MRINKKQEVALWVLGLCWSLGLLWIGSRQNFPDPTLPPGFGEFKNPTMIAIALLILTILIVFSLRTRG